MNERLAEIAARVRVAEREGWYGYEQQARDDVGWLLSLVRDLEGDVHSLTVELRDLQNRLGESDRNTGLAVWERNECDGLSPDKVYVVDLDAVTGWLSSFAERLGGEQGSPCVETKEGLENA